MKLFFAFLLAVLLVQPILRAESFRWADRLRISGTPGDHSLFFATRANYRYQIQMGTDLQLWADLSANPELGTGAVVEHHVQVSEVYPDDPNATNPPPEIYYRVVEFPDPDNAGFLALPADDPVGAAPIPMVDGVRFAFDLGIENGGAPVFAALPAKIRIRTMPADGGGTPEWTLIGAISDFAERNDENGDPVKFVRGSAVWLPDSPGRYFVWADALDSSGTLLASAARTVMIAEKAPPSVSIVSGPADTSTDPVELSFTLNVDETVRRVEYYDGDVLLGSDVQPGEDPQDSGYPDYGDEIVDLQGNAVLLLKGVHNITARAYDWTGAWTETSEAYQITVTGDNARPTLDLVSVTVTHADDTQTLVQPVPPDQLIEIVEGESFDIQYNADDPDEDADVADVSAYRNIGGHGDGERIAGDDTTPFEDLTVDTADWDAGTYMIEVVAADSNSDESHPSYFRVYVKDSSDQEFAGGLVAELADANPVTHDGTKEWVADTITVRNPRFTGRHRSSGIFSQAHASGLDFDEGVLLTTGKFSLWDEGDVDGVDDDGVWQDQGEKEYKSFAIGDFDLENRVAGNYTADAVVLEFDIECPNGQIELEYQFGSEEYDEYVGAFNDSFMILVDGALVSLLPDASDILDVNTVNAGSTWDTDLPITNRHLFLSDGDDILGDDEIIPIPPAPRLEYDGMIVRLRSHIFVEPGSTHHVRIAIADVNDCKLDSALFLRSGSLKTMEPQP